CCTGAVVGGACCQGGCTKRDCWPRIWANCTGATGWQASISVSAISSRAWKAKAEKHDDVAGQGHGIVDVFQLDGTLRQRFAEHDQLNSPWGVALAPTGFGELGGALWIGNFGNGHINALDPESGKFLSKVRDPKGKAILIDGLWTIRFGSNNGN